MLYYINIFMRIRRIIGNITLSPRVSFAGFSCYSHRLGYTAIEKLSSQSLWRCDYPHLVHV